MLNLYWYSQMCKP